MRGLKVNCNVGTCCRFRIVECRAAKGRVLVSGEWRASDRNLCLDYCWRGARRRTPPTHSLAPETAHDLIVLSSFRDHLICLFVFVAIRIQVILRCLDFDIFLVSSWNQEVGIPVQSMTVILFNQSWQTCVLFTYQYYLRNVYINFNN